jgi:GNAT superfamily N-acetyltransferase
MDRLTRRRIPGTAERALALVPLAASLLPTSGSARVQQNCLLPWIDAWHAPEVAVATPDITFQLLDGTQAAAHAADLQALHAEVYAGPPYGRNEDAAVFADRFRVQRRQPGFVLAEARHGGYLVGYAAGMPLRPSTSWWRNLTTAPPEEVTAEHPGRTFALVELLVRASWRRQGVAQTLHDLILADRREERATLTVLPAAAPAQNAFQKWGWRKVARTRGRGPGSPVSDVLIATLPASHAP